MPRIHTFEKILRMSITCLGFPLAIVQSIISKYTLAKHGSPGKLVKVGPYHLHAIVQGRAHSHRPTVILESGMGGCSLDWALVQPELSRYTRVMSYDRAGFGWSIHAVEEPTIRRYVQDLRKLLVELNIAPPYLLVGHSYGGMIMRQFAAEYPDEVSGIVLVDSTHEQRHLQSQTSTQRSKHGNLLRLGYLLSPIGVPRWFKQHIGSKRLPSHIQRTVQALGYRTNAYKAAYSEYLCTVDSAAELQASSPLRMNLPILVLTAGKQSEEWKKDQRLLLSLTTRCRNIVVEDSWHSIQIHKPQTVIQSVLELMEESIE
jgi:pimeloyl-ACP methyl ester carboxylesterase